MKEFVDPEKLDREFAKPVEFSLEHIFATATIEEYWSRYCEAYRFLVKERNLTMATAVSVNTPPRIIPLEEGWNKEIKEKVRG
jgi:hypothetical protein